MRFVWILALSIACSSKSAAPAHDNPTPSTPDRPTTPAPDPGGALPAAWLTCASDADCEAIEMGCCDHCNGGWVLGVNKASVDAAKAKHHDRCEPNTPCTDRGCGGVKGVCRDGACTWAWDEKMDGNYVAQPNTIKN